MTWTYSGNPASSSKDEVRFLMQDTVSTRPLLQDEEIEYLLDQYGPNYQNNIAVAALGCDLLSGRFASEVSISADGVSVGTDQLQQKYTALASSLRDQYRRQTGVGVEPYAGGIDRFEVPDHSVRPPNFGIGMDDNLRAGSQRYGRHGEIPESWGAPGQDYW